MNFPINTFRQLRPYDKLTLGYLLIVLLLLALSPNRPAAAGRIAVVHVAAILLILLITKFADRSRVLQVVHDLYPMALFMALFSEFTHLTTVLFPHWMEPLLIKFDGWMFGGSPQHWTITHFSPVTLEFLAFAYWSYYLIIPATLFLVYHKNYPHELIATTTRMCLTMYACYVLFILLPARGPQDVLPANGALMSKNGLFTNMVRTIQSYGSVHGAAFPSSHVAVAWAMFFALQRLYPKIALFAALLITALTLSVITMGYHFSLDAIGGVVLAIGVNSAWRQKEDRTKLETQMNH